MINRRNLLKAVAGTVVSPALLRMQNKAGVLDIDNMVINEDELVASICRESFYEFVLEIWDEIVTDPFENNWHIKYLCDELQEIAERVFRNEPLKHNLIINISPGTTKSTIVSILFPAWIWTRKPNAGIIGCSFGHDLAQEMNRKTRMVIKTDKYRRLFPEISLLSDQDAKGFFVLKTGGMRKCTGVGGDITGRHGDFILIDDPINPRGARSEAEIETANLFIKETLFNRKKNKAVAPMIMIMQRLSEDDCTGMMLNKWKIPVKHICIPAELSDNVKPPELKQYYRDSLMDPKRLPKVVLDQHRLTGEYYFAGQFMQSPIPLGGAMFHVERILIDTPHAKMEKIVRYWDKAGTKDSGAYTVGLKLGRDINKRIWILDVVRGQWASDEREAHIKLTAELDGFASLIGIEQEPGSGGKESAENSVKNLHGWRVQLDRPTGDKAQRADPISTQVNAGNVSMINAHWNHAFIEELRFFSLLNSKYKDQVDALSGAYKLTNETILVVGGGLITQGR